jgi:gamma-glutamyltranspeptidase / glutathione hydrolase
LSLEEERFDPAIVEYLKRVGYKIDPKESFSFYLGAIHAVLKSQTTGKFQGVAEIRRDGTAAGF